MVTVRNDASLGTKPVSQASSFRRRCFGWHCVPPLHQTPGNSTLQIVLKYMRLGRGQNAIFGLMALLVLDDKTGAIRVTPQRGGANEEFHRTVNATSKRTNPSNQ